MIVLVVHPPEVALDVLCRAAGQSVLPASVRQPILRVIVIRGKPLFNSREFRLGQRNILVQSQQVRVSFEKLRFR
jgi:hypothetical protein